MPKLIDSHTHVQFAAYADDMYDVVKRALDNDIWFVTVGTQRDTSRAAIALAERYTDGVYATVGLHPIHIEASFHDKNELGSDLTAQAFTGRGETFDYDAYHELGMREKVVAIGECGLDYYRLGSETKAKQKDVFMKHIALSGAVRKPLMIHCRQALSASLGHAYDDVIDILRAEKNMLNDIPGIAHFFAGEKKHARAFLNLGFKFSFGGVTSFARDYDEVIRYIGLDNILLETDAPYVTPVPFRGKRNEPSYVSYVCEAIAKILQVDTDIVAQRTTENAKGIFRI
ncbi:MAG: TatD family hydrolase [bacterium]